MKEQKNILIETWIMENIENKTFSFEKKLPSEKELMERFEVSKMTVRNVINRLKSKGVLFSIKGSSIFVSPFYKYNIIYNTKDYLKSSESITLPSSQEMPKHLKDIFDLKGIKNQEWMAYVKTYFIKGKIVSYSISWINKKNCPSISYDYLQENSFLDYIEQEEGYSINNIIISKVEKTTESDVSFLNLSKTVALIPTDYSGYCNDEGKWLQIRIKKTTPKNYINYSIKHQIITK